ncbi:hypothetical protein DPMN_170591 [Dreissena polymorpha]|uniref:Uncharacterized protein n=1 Tax=Dreissena polymorpha TaxID=45954 RepID=A0A9D4IBP1_DREPO|nr:hypothetical protein DPMN_170591 [Dreissena polymorpha]
MLHSTLKTSGYAGSYLNEDLRKTWSDLLFKARNILQLGKVDGVWTPDGTIDKS